MGPGAEFQQQWLLPKDMLSVLMILGDSLVHAAIAQSVGYKFALVPFSFGWVGYAFRALTYGIGKGRMLPEPDWPALLVNIKSGYARDNSSWVLGRLLRDSECGESFEPSDSTKPPFKVIVHKCAPGLPDPSKDWVYISGAVAITLQFSIALIPWALFGDWAIFLIVALGTFLALVQTNLPEWKAEKWDARVRQQKSVALLRGNGTRHVIVLVGDMIGLDLEDLAGSMRTPTKKEGRYPIILACGWLLLLFNICGLQRHTWYMMGVGIVGIIHNCLVAGAPRDHSALGIETKKLDTFEGPTTMNVLKELDMKYPRAGYALLPIFFPGFIREEDGWWSAREEFYRKNHS